MLRLYAQKTESLKSFTENNYAQASFYWNYLLKNREIRVNGKRVGEDQLEAFKAEYGLDDSVTADTLWGEIRNIVDMKLKEQTEAEKAASEEEAPTENADSAEEQTDDSQTDEAQTEDTASEESADTETVE